MGVSLLTAAWRVGTVICLAHASIFVRGDNVMSGSTSVASTNNDAPQYEIIDSESSTLAMSDGPVEYSITFENKWNSEDHPFGPFPPGPHWSPPFFVSHNCRYRMWGGGRKSTTGVKIVAETGDTSQLQSEVEKMGNNYLNFVKGDVQFIEDEESQTIDDSLLCVDEEHPLVSGISMIAPSPDWFSGFYNFIPSDVDGFWYDSVTLAVIPWDAGTDSGETYRSGDSPTRPKEDIGQFSVVDGGVFVTEDGSEILPVAYITLNRVETTSQACADVAEDKQSRTARRNRRRRVRVNIRGTVRWRTCEGWVKRDRAGRCFRRIGDGRFRGQMVNRICRKTCFCEEDMGSS